jgi:hypothetical protein
MNMLSKIRPFLDYFDSPWLWGLTFFFVAMPWVLKECYNALKFHSDFIFYKSKSYDESIGKIKEGTVDYELLEECKRQELFFAHTRIRASKLEREQIARWMKENFINIEMIRMSWLMIGVKDSKMSPIITWFDAAYMWYGLVAISVCLSLSLMSIVAFMLEVTNPASLNMLSIFCIFLLLSFLLYRQINPIIFARRIKRRLENSQKADSEKNMLIASQKKKIT